MNNAPQPSLRKRILRGLGYGAGSVALLLLLMALALRFVVMTDIDRFKPQIERMASQAVNLTVQIGAIDTAWEGITPRFILRDITLLTPQGATVLRLPQADAELSWLSPFFGRAHLSRLRLEGLVIEAERDSQGVIRVAGQVVNGPENDAGFGDWLLVQREILIRNGRLTWRDQRLGAPPLVLDAVDIGLRNNFSQHVLTLRAQPPENAALNLELNATLYGKTLSDLNAWRGEINARLQETNATALKSWAPWAQDIVHRGVGDIHLRIDFAAGMIHAVSAQTTLREVVLQLEAGLPALQLDRLSGEIGWRRDKEAHELFASKLIFTQADGTPSAPANLRLRFTPKPNGKGIATGQIEAENLRIEAFAALSGSIPMPRALFEQIERRKPRGHIMRAKGQWQDKGRFSLSAHATNLGMEAADGLPGVLNLSGEIEMNEQAGHLKLDSKQLRFSDLQRFRFPIQLDLAQGEITWKRDKTGTPIKIRTLHLANADFDGEVQGQLTLRPDRAPDADLRAHLQRGEGAAVWRYLPHEVNDDTFHWLRDSLLAGHTRNARMVLRGPLDHYPFSDGSGEFRIDIPAHQARLRYAPDWPEITGIEGSVIFKGKGMSIHAHAGMIEGVSLPKVTVHIDDLFQNQTRVVIDGEANGPLPGYLNFIAHSPVARAIGHTTDAMRGKGDARLQLHIDLPLENMDRFSVNGQLHLAGNRIDPGSDLPTLDAVEGALSFTQNQLTAQNLAVKVLGKPARLNLTSQPGGALQADLSGSARGADLDLWLPPWITQRLKGQSNYRARIRLNDGSPVFELESDLSGMEIALPAPLDKPPTAPLPLKLRSRAEGKGRLSLLQLGEVVHVRMNSGDGPDRLALRLGRGDLHMPEQPGIVVSGKLDALDIDHWRAVLPAATGATAATGPTLIDLSVDELVLLDRIWHEAHFRLKPVKEGYTLSLDSREAKSGSLSFKPGHAGVAPRFDARFDALTVPQSITRPTPDAPPPHEVIEGQLEINQLTIEGRALGQLNMGFRQIPAGTEVTRLSLENSGLKVNASGFLASHPRRTSRFAGEISTPDIGRLADSLGYPAKLRGGDAKLQVHKLEWSGGGVPHLTKASGVFDLQVGKGQFLKLDPGVARLLGILSLQALPRRITLDFRDIFSEGFAFDRIQANHIVLAQGAAYLKEASMEGPAAKVQMNGVVNLAREDLRLRIMVEPRIDDTVAIASGLAGGPAVAAGVYLAQELAKRLLDDPIGQITRFDYQVSGRWDDPKIEKIKIPSAQPNPTAP
jgi:uncharacterized protein (TIGR02099 family)